MSYDSWKTTDPSDRPRCKELVEADCGVCGGDGTVSPGEGLEDIECSVCSGTGRVDVECGEFVYRGGMCREHHRDMKVEEAERRRDESC